MAPSTLNSDPCHKLEGEVTALESELQPLQNRLSRLLSSQNPPSKAVLKLEDQIANLQKTLQAKQSDLSGCRRRHH